MELPIIFEPRIIAHGVASLLTFSSNKSSSLRNRFRRVKEFQLPTGCKGHFMPFVFPIKVVCCFVSPRGIRYHSPARCARLPRIPVVPSRAKNSLTFQLVKSLSGSNIGWYPKYSGQVTFRACSEFVANEIWASYATVPASAKASEPST